jgi:nicotinate-nucleotide adenylyltransferase
MMKLAVRGKKGLKVSTLELMRRGISYTIDTLKEFKKRFPAAELVLIIGADNLAQFNSWKSPKTILTLAVLAVYKRKGFNQSLRDNEIDFILLKGRMLRVSSTDIRNKIEIGFPIRELVPNSIVLYIKQHSLYKIPAYSQPKRQFHEKHRFLS